MEISNFLGKCPQARVLQFLLLANCIDLFITCVQQPPPLPEYDPAMELDRFQGKWLEVKKVGFEHLADVLGVTGENRKFFENSKSELAYSRDGDNWSIRVGIQGIPSDTTFNFKLGEPYSSLNIDGTPLKSVVRGEGPLLVERHESLGTKPFVMNIVREVVGDIMTAKTTIDGITMEAIFRRV